MNHDRHLIDTIKTHYARKSSAQLQVIVQAKNHDRWSPEALVAAGEVLQDRLAGRAQEPQVAEEEPDPPPYHYEPGETALGVLAGLLTGYLVIPSYKRGEHEDTDLPVPFGPKMAWLALDTTDTEAVATALGLVEVRTVTWAEGINAAQQASVFVTPPLGDWTLAVGAALFLPDRAEAFVKPLLERLSRQFGDAQYFCTNRDVELHLWARARRGQLVRGYGWFGAEGITFWDECRQTKEERDLGFQFFDGRSPAIEQTQNKKVSLPGEGAGMQLACLWSIDPTSLDEQFKEPLRGILGNIARAGNRTDR